MRGLTLENCFVDLLRLQKSSQVIHSCRSLLNLRVARSKMKWMRRVMARSATVFLPAGSTFAQIRGY